MTITSYLDGKSSSMFMPLQFRKHNERQLLLEVDLIDV